MKDQSNTDGRANRKTSREASAYGWFPLHHNWWLANFAGRPPEDQTVMIILMAMVSQRGGPVPLNDRYLAAQARVTTPAFKKALGRLAGDSLLYVEDGHIHIEIVQEAIENREEKTEKNRNSANKRWGKDKQNQQNGDANAWREENRREHEEGVSPPGKTPSPQSPSLSTDNRGQQNETDESARPPAPDGASSASTEPPPFDEAPHCDYYDGPQDPEDLIVDYDFEPLLDEGHAGDGHTSAPKSFVFDGSISPKAFIEEIEAHTRITAASTAAWQMLVDHLSESTNDSSNRPAVAKYEFRELLTRGQLTKSAIETLTETRCGGRNVKAS